jgi:hypothetical protein
MELEYCSYCNGGGYINVDLINEERLTKKDLTIYLDGKYKSIQCPKCWGKKRIDWIEQIIGFRVRSHHENA